MALTKVASAMATHTPIAAGGVLREMQETLDETNTILNYGAVPYYTLAACLAGVDSQPAIMAALADNKIAKIPTSGYFLIGSPIILQQGQGLEGINGRPTLIAANNALFNTKPNPRAIIESFDVFNTVVSSCDLGGIKNIALFGNDYGRGIELGNRIYGSASLCDISNVGGTQLFDGVLLNGFQNSVLDNLYFDAIYNVADGGGRGLWFRDDVGGVAIRDCLFANFTINIEVNNGHGVHFLNVGSGTAADNTMGPGYTNYWTTSLLTVVDSTNVSWTGGGFEYLSTHAISEVQLISTTAAKTSPTSLCKFINTGWAGITSHAGSRVTLGATGGINLPVYNTLFERCNMLTGSTSDILIQNAKNTTVHYCVRQTAYNDTNPTRVQVTYATGDAWSNSLDQKVTETNIPINYPTVVGVSTGPVIAVGWQLIADVSQQRLGFYPGDGARIYFDGVLERTTGVSGDVVFVMPTGARPEKNMSFVIACVDTTTTAVLKILSTGNVQIYYAGTPTQFSFGGVSYVRVPVF